MTTDQAGLSSLLQHYQNFQNSDAFKAMGIELAEFTPVALQSKDPLRLDKNQLTKQITELDNGSGWICFTGEIRTYCEQPFTLASDQTPLQGEIKQADKHIQFRHLQGNEWLWFEHTLSTDNPTYLCETVTQKTNQDQHRTLLYKRLWAPNQCGGMRPTLALFDGFEDN